MKKLVFFMLFINALCADSIYFMPYDAKSAVNALIKEIKNAKSEVKIAIYSFTNREIAKAIRDSAKRGVKFKIVFDYRQNIDDKFTQIGYLAKLKNIYACTLQGKNNGKYSGIMHNKLAVIDDKKVIFGSANWSKSAFEINYEMMIISQNRDFITQSSKYINRLLKECAKFY